MLLVVAVVLLCFDAHNKAQGQLPAPTHPNLLRLGYYFVNERWGDDTAAVWPYTNLYIVSPGMFDTGNPNWQDPFAAALQKATINHKAVVLGLPSDTPEQPTMTWDAMLDIAQNYWGQITHVEISHEVDRTAQQMQDRIDAFNAKVIARGLTPRPMEATFGTTQVFTTEAIYAPGLTHVAIEAYLAGPGDPNPQVNVNNLNNYLAAAKARVRGAGKKMFLIMQAYDQTGQWPNMTTLEALQRPVYLNAYNDPDVEAILMFNYGVPNGTKYHPELQQAHREIGSAMGISPAMNIDAPVYGTTVAQPFHIGGWAIDRAAATGSGVDTLHVWAYPWTGAPPFILGAAVHGGSRPDVAGVYGSQFQFSGWGINVSGMAPGWYTIVVYSHSSVSGLFNKAQIVVVNVL